MRPVAAALLILVAACGSGGGEALVATTSSTTSTSVSTSGSSTTSSVPPATTSTDAPTTTTTTTLVTTTTEAAKPPLAGRIVVVDPGHNGANAAHPEEINALVDAGGFQKACNTTGTATDAGYSESRVNFEVALLVRARLEELGAEVRMTRTDDTGWGPCVDERGGAAAGADLLLSIHADGADPSGHGFHVIHPEPLAGYTDATAGESAQVAATVRDSLVEAGFVPSTYLGAGGLDERGDLGTLNRSPAPAVMVEAGNLRNSEDAAMLTSPGGQARLAQALVDGVRKQFGA